MSGGEREVVAVHAGVCPALRSWEVLARDRAHDRVPPVLPREPLRQRPPQALPRGAVPAGVGRERVPGLCHRGCVQRVRAQRGGLQGRVDGVPELHSAGDGRKHPRRCLRAVRTGVARRGARMCAVQRGPRVQRGRRHAGVQQRGVLGRGRPGGVQGVRQGQGEPPLHPRIRGPDRVHGVRRERILPGQ